MKRFLLLKKTVYDLKLVLLREYGFCTGFLCVFMIQVCLMYLILYVIVMVDRLGIRVDILNLFKKSVLFVFELGM